MSSENELVNLRHVWDAIARHGRERANWDPHDRRGLKNVFIEELHRQAIHTEAHLRGSEVVLDLGCGTGLLEEHLRGRVRVCVGIDISPAMLKHASQAHMQGASFCLFDGKTLPFMSGVFDLILAKGLTYHLSDALLIDVLRECRRTLKSEGRLLTIDNCSSHPRRQDGRADNMLYRSSDMLIALCEAVGWTSLCRYPIRRGRSLAQYLIRYGFYSKKRIPALARRELQRLRFSHKLHTRYYMQCLHVFC